MARTAWATACWGPTPSGSCARRPARCSWCDGSGLSAQGAGGGRDLAHREAAVAGGDPAVPVRPEAFLGEAAYRALGEGAVLEAPSGQDHVLLAHPSGHGQDHL